jgi:DNA helicase-2/ATP-dependent DNA helicase PcrA
MDFDDLLFNTALLFRDHPEAMLKYQNASSTSWWTSTRTPTSCSTTSCVRSPRAHENLTVVGDDSQSIYRFRGPTSRTSSISGSDYPDHSVFKLEQNYRSTKTIVGAANSLIDKNKDQIEKTIWTDNDEGAPIKVHRTLSDNEEGHLRGAQTSSRRRCRSRCPTRASRSCTAPTRRAAAMEEALRKLNIPYRIYGGLSFYQRKEIKDLLAYFRLVCNPNDEEALKRVINYPTRGIGQTTIEKLMVLAGERNDADLGTAHQHQDGWRPRRHAEGARRTS